MSRHLALLLMTMVTLPAAAFAETIPAVTEAKLHPAGKWTVEYADWKCALHRQFSSGGKPSRFSLSREPLTSTAWLKIAIDGEGGGRRADGDAIMLVDGQRHPDSLHYNIYDAGRERVREFMLNLDRHDPGTVRERLRFWTRRHGDLEVEATTFQAGWKALGACMTDLYAGLGIDKSDYARMVSKPEGNIFSSIDLPSGGADFHFVVLYWVTAEGRVEDCRLLKPSGNARFDETLCKRLEAKARFKPARDAAGQPIRVPQFENMNLVTIVTRD